MMRARAADSYDGTMRGAIADYVHRQLHRRAELLPTGLNWAAVLAFDTAVVGACLIAGLQRPMSDLPVSALALAVTIAPFIQFYAMGIKFKGSVIWVAWMAAAALFLFATSTPVASDFAPLLLVLMVGEVCSTAGVLGGFLSTMSAVALLMAASTLHRLDQVVLYLGILGMGWLVGCLMRIQAQLMEEQQRAHAALAAHAATDERRRIAREVHDVIAHSLSITLLHLTGARRGLQEDHDIDDAVDALEQAERLGRQAMTDIRRTVGLLDAAPMNIAPEPGVDDIAGLVDDFVRAGLDLTFEATGSADAVSAGTGLALYRIVQESLANVAKHAPDAASSVVLRFSRTSATLNIVNNLPVTVGASRSDGRGVRGMRQRVERLGGIISIGPFGEAWAVRANIPLTDADNRSCPWVP